MLPLTLLTTRKVTLPEGYKISYGATPTEVTFDATTAATGVDVPDNEAITVTVPASVDTWYVLDPNKTAGTATATDYKSAGETFSIAAGATAVNYTTALADKYYKVSATANAAVGTVDGITFAHVALADTYKKANETVTIALTGTGTATAGGQTATVTVSATNTTGAATTSTITMPTTTGDAFAGTDIVVSLGTPSDKNIVITISVA